MDNRNSKRIEEEKKEFTDELDVKKFLATVNSKIKENITEDYILAKLDKNQRTYITEQHKNAEYLKMLIERLSHSSKNQEEKEKIKKIAEQVYRLFSTESEIIVNLHRNEKENYIIEYITGKHKTETIIPEEEEKSKTERLLENEEKT